MCSLVTTREAFDVALLSGDLKTVQAFFAQRDVLDDVRNTNASIVDTKPTDPRQWTLSDGSLPWFRRPMNNGNDTDDIPLLSAARRGHTEVLAWLFSHECRAFMGETLAFLLPLIAQYDGPRFWYQPKWTSDALVMETVLSSPVFHDVIPGNDQQAFLDFIAGRCQTPAIIRLVIAHGAQINEALTPIARSCKTDCVSMLEAEGAVLVGADVVQMPSEFWAYPHVATFMERGIDLRGCEQLLMEAADRGEDTAVDTLLSVGFLDVDARDDDGRTALMRVASVDPTTDLHPHFADPTPGIAASLLKYCYVNAVDDYGCTALHFAAENNHNVAMMLLEHGADPNLRDHDGDTALDQVDDYAFEYRNGEWMIRAFLDRGADPFEVPPAREGEADEDRRPSFYERLRASLSGVKFIQANPQYFER